VTQYFSTIVIAVALFTAGCGGSLNLNLVRSAQYKPSNVAVFFSVEKSDGEPVTNLIAGDFAIYEDGSLVSVSESRQTIINPQVAAEQYALLLVDMSASITDTDQVPYVVQAVQGFVSQVGKYERVAVYAFDGSREIHPIMPFTESEDATWRGLTSLQQFRARDPSTNLHGAVIQATEKLNAALKRSRVPLHYGTLIVFTDGTDHAARASREQMLKALENTHVAQFAIGVGSEIDDATLEKIGRDRFIRVQDSRALSQAFNDIGARVIALSRRYYLLSYCSPARAGKHEVTVRAIAKDMNGELKYDFDAAGFQPGCDPTVPPPFSTSTVPPPKSAAKPEKASVKGNVKASIKAE
jgi:uncharacterized protein YegL